MAEIKEGSRAGRQMNAVVLFKVTACRMFPVSAKSGLFIHTCSRFRHEKSDNDRPRVCQRPSERQNDLRGNTTMYPRHKEKESKY